MRCGHAEQTVPVSRRSLPMAAAVAVEAGTSRPGRRRGGRAPASPEGDRLPRPPAPPQPADLGGRRPQADRGGRPARDRPALLLDPHPAAAGHGRGLPRVQPVGRRGDEAVPGPGARLLLRQPRPSRARRSRRSAAASRTAGSSASSSTTSTAAPTRSSSPIVELAIELRVPILHHAGHLHYFARGAAPHLRRRPPRRALPALSRGHADLRPHLRRRRLGVDDQGPPRRARACCSTSAAA